MKGYLLSATALSLLLIGPVTTVAQVRNVPAPPSYSAAQTAATTRALGPMLSERQLVKQLHQQGYTSVGMLKLMGDTYEARGFKNGKSLAIEVNARTGKILSADPAPRD
jgi:Peptidase propeptide and YPEB domain